VNSQTRTTHLLIIKKSMKSSGNCRNKLVKLRIKLSSIAGNITISQAITTRNSINIQKKKISFHTHWEDLSTINSKQEMTFIQAIVLQQQKKLSTNSKKELIRGFRSIINYKSNQPLNIHNKCIHLQFKNNNFYVSINLLNRHSFKKYNFANTAIKFKILVRDNSTKAILERCISNEYKISESQLIYNKKKKCWFLNLSYAFEIKSNNSLDPNKILGVDLGIHYPICASVYGSLERFTIDGGEIDNFRRRVESRKRSMLKQGKNCGDGRIGHGIKARNKPVYNIEDKIARFRDTANHKYSRALIEYAVKHNCGTIQMEDLTGITDIANRFLKNWSYYDLQTKIEYKAKEAGINIVYIDPKNTSRRCSKCGYIDKENRETQSRFICLKCGFKENADYNASQNIGIKDIDKLIKEDVH